ncbi:MAG: hypothetical protein LBG73_04185, partial [Spirochaetaceae bacterium]|nr:hypothetical protein [Spirochaetaceae bacterium]
MPNRTCSMYDKTRSAKNKTSSMHDKTRSAENKTIQSKRPDCSALSRMSFAKSGTIGTKSLDGSILNRTS